METVATFAGNHRSLLEHVKQTAQDS
jgi:hypothetical protein